MPWKKRALSGKNLGVYAQKKVRQKDDKKDQILSSPGPALSMADQLGPEEPFEWDVTNIEDPAPDVPIDLGSDDKIKSNLHYIMANKH